MGLIVDGNSRVHGVENGYRTNTVPWRTLTGGIYLSDGDTVAMAGGTANTNLPDRQAYSGETVELTNSYSERRIGRIRVAATITGTVAKTSFGTVGTIPAYRIGAGAESSIRVTAFLVGAVAGNASIHLDVGGTVATVGTGGSVSGNFRIEFEVFEAPGTNMIGIATLVQGGRIPTVTRFNIPKTEFTSTSTIGLSTTLSAVGDSLRLDGAALYIT